VLRMGDIYSGSVFFHTESWIRSNKQQSLNSYFKKTCPVYKPKQKVAINVTIFKYFLPQKLLLGFWLDQGS